MGILESNLNKRREEAEIYLSDERKRAHFLLRLEKKLKVVPKVGEKLARIPLFVSLLYDYFKGNYTEIPIGSLLSLIACLIYFVSAIDFIPDIIPVVGYLDDAACLALCWQWISSDVIEYENWRNQTSQSITTENSKEQIGVLHQKFSYNTLPEQ